MAGKNEYTVFDYLQWRGDLTLQQDPFNEVDNLVLCIIASHQPSEDRPPVEQEPQGRHAHRGRMRPADGGG